MESSKKIKIGQVDVSTLPKKPTKWTSTDVTHTGNTNETILKAIEFSGTDWSENDIMAITAEFKKVGTAGGCVWRIKVNATNDLSGSSTLGLLNGSAPAVDIGRELKRCVFKSGGLIEHPALSTNNFTDITGASLMKTTSSLTYSSTWFLLITGQLANSADSISCPLGYIEKK